MSGEWDERRHPVPPLVAPPPQQPPIGAVPAPPPGYLPPPPGSGSGGGPRWLVVAAIVLVVVIGTGVTAVLTSDDDPQVAPPDLRLDDLRPALLTQDDLGGDWEPIDEAAERESVTPEISEECGRAAEERAPDAPEVSPSVIAAFWHGPTAGTPIVTHILVPLDESMASFDDLRENADVCREQTIDDGDTITTIVQRLVDADGPGDDVLAYEIESTVTYEDGDQPPSLTHGYALYVRRDGVMSIVQMTGGLEDAPSDGEVLESEPPDIDLVHQYAERADEKLRAVLEE